MTQNTTPANAGTTPAPGRVLLGGNCTIRESAALRTHLLEQLALPDPYEIDGTAVERIDTAGAQLILAFALDCLDRNRGYYWKGRSAALDEAIALMGIGSLLESPGVSTTGAAS